MLKGKKSVLIVHVMEDRIRLMAGQASWLGFEPAGFTDLEADVRRGGESSEEWVPEMERFILQNNLRAPQIIIALPRKLLIWRYFRVPPVPQENLNNLAEFEIEKHLPLNREEVYYRFLPIQRTEEGWQMLLAGTKKSFLKPLENALETMGMRVEAILPDIWGLIHLASVQGLDLKGGYPVLVTRGTDSVEVAVFRDNLPVAYQQHAIHGDGEADRGSPEDSETLSRRARMTAGAINGAVDEAVMNLSIEDKLESGYLFGDDLDADRLIQMLNADTVKKWTALGSRDINLLRKRTDLEGRPRILATAGLALGAPEAARSPLNMISAPDSGKPARTDWKATAVLTLLLLISAAFLYGSMYYTRRERLRALDTQLAELKGQVEKVKSLNDTLDNRESHIKELDKVLTRRSLAVEILRELTETIPASAYLNQLVYRKGTVEISGHADSASELISSLESSPLFKNVSFAAPITSRGQAKEKFKIKLTLE